MDSVGDGHTDAAGDGTADGLDQSEDSDVAMDVDSDGENPSLVEYELVRDDRVADAATLPVQGGLNPGSRVGLKLTPPGPGTILQLRFGISPFGNPMGEFEAQIYAADAAGELPGTPLLDAPVPVQLGAEPSGNAFHDAAFAQLDVSDRNIEVDGPFYVAIIWPGSDSAQAPNLAVDVHNAPDGALIDFGDGFGWLGFTDVGIPMLRAVMEIDASQQPARLEFSGAALDCEAHDPLLNPGATVLAGLEPPSYPFQVEAIRYDLHDYSNGPGNPACSAELPHQVSIFAGPLPPAGMPSLSATYAQTLDIDTTLEVIPVTLDLDEPLTLSAGEVLYVAIETPGDDPGLCVGACYRDSDADTSWLSDDSAAPWSWSPLQGGGAIRVIGSGRQQ